MTIEDLMNTNLWDKAKSSGLKFEEARIKAESKVTNKKGAKVGAA